MKLILLSILMISVFATPVLAQKKFETDIIKTSDGELKITFLGHGSLLLNFKNNNIYIDPFSKLADYAALPKAEIIFLTHHHRDHLDQNALKQIRSPKTELVLTELCAEKVKNGTIMKNGDIKTIKGIRVKAIPAYNLIHRRDNGQLFHPKGEGNGYVLSFGDKKVYIAGDTENIPEMNALKNIDYAFLPMNLPYTMTPEMVAEAARSFSPKVLYPYHYGKTDTSKIIELLKDSQNIEIRIRKLQ
jgi:L-ascorbate metabolism protein UlaG (beta-lactamase superfamily)